MQKGIYFMQVICKMWLILCMLVNNASRSPTLSLIYQFQMSLRMRFHKRTPSSWHTVSVNKKQRATLSLIRKATEEINLCKNGKKKVSTSKISVIIYYNIKYSGQLLNDNQHVILSFKDNYGCRLSQQVNWRPLQHYVTELHNQDTKVAIIEGLCVWFSPKPKKHSICQPFPLIWICFCLFCFRIRVSYQQLFKFLQLTAHNWQKWKKYIPYMSLPYNL